VGPGGFFLDRDAGKTLSRFIKSALGQVKLIGCCLLLGTYEDERAPVTAGGHCRGAAAMTDRSQEMIPQDEDLRNLARVVSACTLGLWAFAAGLLIGVFLFS
jgi:hypothetical protein